MIDSQVAPVSPSLDIIETAPRPPIDPAVAAAIIADAAIDACAYVNAWNSHADGE